MSVEVNQQERARFLIRQAFNQWDGEGSFADLIAGQMVAYRAEGEESMRERAANVAHCQAVEIGDKPDSTAKEQFIALQIRNAIRSIDTRGE